jgi:hypothetical protein
MAPLLAIDEARRIGDHEKRWFAPDRLSGFARTDHREERVLNFLDPIDPSASAMNLSRPVACTWSAWIPDASGCLGRAVKRMDLPGKMKDLSGKMK